MKFISEVADVSYFKDGKNRVDRMREGLISDGTRTVKMTIWGDMIDMIREDHLIQITSASSRIYNEELIISTNFSSSICYLTETINIEFDEVTSTGAPQKEDFIVCCPNIESIKINTRLGCKICKNKVTVMPGTGLCVCGTCKREFTVKSIEETPGCSQKFAVLDLKNFDGALTVTIFEDVLRNFGEEDETRLKNKILNLKNHDFLVLKKKKVVTEIKEHEN